MLTDYHLHLRPDDVEATAARATSRPRTSSATSRRRGRPGSRSSGVSEHVHRFTDALEVWDHPFWRENARRRPRAPTASSSARRRCGWGSRWTTSADARTGSRTCSTASSSTTSSARSTSCRDGAVDHDGYDVWERVGDADRVWRLYFETLAEAVLHRALRHRRPPRPRQGLGLRTGPRPSRDPRFHYEPLVEAIAETGTAVEVSTAGWRKPVGELYPADAFAEMCVDAGAAFALSSDAHRPEDVGYEYERAVEAMRGWGVRADRGLRSAASAGWSRSADAGRDRLRQPPLRRGSRRWSWAGSRSSTSRGWRATPTPTSSPTR